MLSLGLKHARLVPSQKKTNITIQATLSSPSTSFSIRVGVPCDYLVLPHKKKNSSNMDCRHQNSGTDRIGFPVKGALETTHDQMYFEPQQ